MVKAKHIQSSDIYWLLSAFLFVHDKVHGHNSTKLWIQNVGIYNDDDIASVWLYRPRSLVENGNISEWEKKTHKIWKKNRSVG